MLSRYFLLILFAVGLALFLPALPNKFVWDDEEQVVANTQVHDIANLPQFFMGSTFNSGGATEQAGLYYKPLMSASFALIYTIFGEQPWAFHLVQILLHIGSTALLFIVLRQMWKREWVAGLMALIFLIHPLNVESVVYISALQDTLYMFFGMLGLTWVVVSENKLKPIDYLIVALCLLLAMLSKETGVIFGLLIAIYLGMFRSRREMWVWSGVATALLGVYLYLRLAIAQVPFGTHMFTPMASLPLGERILQLPWIVGHYLSQFVWPSQLAISQHWVIEKLSIWAWMGLTILLAGWLAGLMWGLSDKTRHYFVFFWLWSGGALLFHSQIFPLDMTVADRWFYLPMIGILGSVGSLHQITKFRTLAYSYARFGTIAIAIIIVALFVRSSVRITNWRDGLTLYTHDIVMMPTSFDLHNNLGVELYRSGRYVEAKSYFEQSTVAAPDWWTNWNNLGVVVEQEGDWEQAATDYQKAIDNGGYYLAYGNYGRVLIKQNKLPEATTFVRNSLKLYPNNATLLELWQYLSILEDK